MKTGVIFFLKMTMLLTVAVSVPAASHIDVYAAEEVHIVDTEEQIYSYGEMVYDILSLTAKYDEILSFERLTKTSQGRYVYLLKFGNPDADRKILITASIHAREYMTSQLVMSMLEEYLSEYDAVQRNGKSYKDSMGNLCFYILPMINPDGVAISQYGLSGVSGNKEKEWLRNKENEGYSLTQIKANAGGTDLNRNFPTGFGTDKNKAKEPSLLNYPGKAPLSEPESQAVAEVIDEIHFEACINYHTQGEVLYYGMIGNTKTNEKKNDELMRIVYKHTRYYPILPKDMPNGSLSDYFQRIQNEPSITVEIGRLENPVPIDQFKAIYKKNFPVWEELAIKYGTEAKK